MLPLPRGAGVRVDRLILVTGATGYIASRLIPRLLDAGFRVRCLARARADSAGAVGPVSCK